MSIKKLFHFYFHECIHHLLNALQTLFHKKNIKPLDIILFLRQFSTLLNAGISLIHCCEILEKSQTKTKLRILIYQMKQQLLSGDMLHHCFYSQSLYFDRLTCQLIQIGEQVGQIEFIFNVVAEHHEKRYQFKQHIKQSLFYPCLITIAALAMTTCMFVFVIPKFADLFHNATQQLPILTQIIFFIATQLQQLYWFFCVLLIIGTAVFLHAPTKQKILTHISQFMTYLPFINHFVQQFILIQFLRQLSLMLHAGMTITDTLELILTMTPSSSFRNHLHAVSTQISTGLQIHQAMQQNHFFPHFMVQMIKVGEESGQLVEMLNKIADMMERDVNQTITRFNQLLEPLIIIMLGVLIGALVLGMYLPIFKLGTTL